MYKFDDIFDKSKAYKYKNWNKIKDQLNLVKKYNFKIKQLVFYIQKLMNLLEMKNL